MLHKLSYSLLLITLSCNEFLYKFSKDSIICWFFSYCSLYLKFLFMIISFITSLQIANAHAVAVDIGIAIKLIPKRDKVIELDVVAILTNVSIDFVIVVIVLYFS